MSDDLQQRICFLQEGDNGMQVQIVGDAAVLMSMIKSALMSHADVRKLLVPVFMNVMQDGDFMKIMMEDMFTELSGNGEESQDIIDTE